MYAALQHIYYITSHRLKSTYLREMDIFFLNIIDEANLSPQ